MRDTQMMYRTVLLHIPHHMLERDRGILSLADTMVDPFGELRDRLVELLTPSLLDQCNSTTQPTGPALTAASEVPVKAWGCLLVQLSTSSRTFSWGFIQADVALPIIRAHFLANFKLVADLSRMQLLAPAGLKILLEVPHVGSITAAAIRLVGAPSTPSLPTVKEPSATPTISTVEALGRQQLCRGSSGAK